MTNTDEMTGGNEFRRLFDGLDTGGQRAAAVPETVFFRNLLTHKSNHS